ncbi:MAG: hypothetical protein WA833_01035, partial [Nitrosotalea sp.]
PKSSIEDLSDGKTDSDELTKSDVKNLSNDPYISKDIKEFTSSDDNLEKNVQDKDSDKNKIE